MPDLFKSLFTGGMYSFFQRKYTLVDMTGKVAIITGGTSGLGKQSSLALAKMGCHVFIGARNKDKALAVVQEIKQETGNDKIKVLEMQLDDLSSVKQAANTFKSKGLHLDILMNNAGGCGAGGKTKDGFQTAFQVNYLSHFLLTELLLPVLNNGRVINVSAWGHKLQNKIDWNRVRQDDEDGVNERALDNYADTKLCQVLHTRKLSQLHKNINSYSCHPGVVATDVWRNVYAPIKNMMTLFFTSEKDGSNCQVWLAIAPELKNESGEYYFNLAKDTPNPLVNDQAVVDEYYEKSREFVAPFLDQ